MKLSDLAVDCWLFKQTYRPFQNKKHTESSEHCWLILTFKVTLCKNVEKLNNLQYKKTINRK